MSTPSPVSETDTTPKGPAPLLLLLLLVVLAALAWYFLARDQGGIAPSAGTIPAAPVEIGDDSAAAREARAREEAAARERTRRAPAPAAPAVALATPIAAMSSRPDYPADARRRNEAGRVLLRVDVGADGIPTDIAFVDRSGSQSLDRAAMDAVRDWRFTPARAKGQPVASQVMVPVDFVLPSQEQPSRGLASRG